MHARADRLFGRLLIGQWLVAIGVALVASPRVWAAAVLVGGLVTLGPAWLALRRPGTAAARHGVALGQALVSVLLIHLTGGRLETHFHVFGSLALLASYRDWRVLVTASVVVAADHLLRGLVWPGSAFGVTAVSGWRWAEHTAWVAFADVFLIRSCVQSRSEMREIAERCARLEATRDLVEAEVAARTAELRREVAERERLQARLAQADRLESIGRLAAGVAHEINTPAQYVADNTRFLRDGFAGLLAVVEAARSGSPGAGPDLERLAQEVDLDFLREEVPLAIDQSLEGLERVRTIVRALREFSHPGGAERAPADLNGAVASTVEVARNEWKYVAELELRLDPALPPVPCCIGAVNQVVLNLVVNAAHAIAERLERAPREGGKGRIAISTRAVPDWVELRVEDDGAGIPAELVDRIFDPFFTTKDVGRGTGQGLTLAHNVIVRDHGGSIDVESREGRGTAFVVRLPRVAAPAEAAA